MIEASASLPAHFARSSRSSPGCCGKIRWSGIKEVLFGEHNCLMELFPWSLIVWTKSNHPLSCWNCTCTLRIYLLKRESQCLAYSASSTLRAWDFSSSFSFSVALDVLIISRLLFSRMFSPFLVSYWSR